MKIIVKVGSIFQLTFKTILIINLLCEAVEVGNQQSGIEDFIADNVKPDLQTNNAFITRFMSDLKDSPFYWAERELTEEDLIAVCGRIIPRQTKYDEVYEATIMQGHLTQLALDFFVDYLACTKMTGETVYATVPMLQNVDEKFPPLTILEDIHDGFMIKASQDALSTTTPIMRLFAIQTEGIKLNPKASHGLMLNQKRKYLRDNAFWLDGPIMGDALIGICKKQKTFLSTDVLSTWKIEMAKFSYNESRQDNDVIIDAEVLICGHEGKTTPNYYIGFKDGDSSKLSWMKVKWMQDGEYFSIEGSVTKLFSMGKIVKTIEDATKNNRYVWSNNPIPEESHLEMCVNAVSSLRQALPVISAKPKIVGEIKVEPYGEQRAGHLLQCTYYKFVSKNEKDVEQLNVITVMDDMKSTIYVEVVQHGDVYEYEGIKQYIEEGLDEKLSEMNANFVASYAKYGNDKSDEVTPLIQLDKQLLGTMVLDYKCQETMKGIDDIHSYKHYLTMRKKLSLSPHSMKEFGFTSEKIDTNIIQCINTKKEEEDRENNDTWIINPFDPALLSPVHKIGEDNYFLGEGIFYYQEMVLGNIASNEKYDQEDVHVDIKNIFEDNPLLKVKLTQLCAKRRGISWTNQSLPIGVKVQKIECNSYLSLHPVADPIITGIYQCAYVGKSEWNFNAILTEMKLFQVEHENSDEEYNIVWEQKVGNDNKVMLQ